MNNSQRKSTGTKSVSKLNLEDLMRPTHSWMPQAVWSEVLPGLWQGGTVDRYAPDEWMRGETGILITKQDFDSVYTMYASAEPCAMCAGTIYWAGIGRVVFGLAIETMTALGGPAADELSLHAADVLASDGGVVHIRPIVPDDADDVVEFHSRLSERTRYMRYFGPTPTLPPCGC